MAEASSLYSQYGNDDLDAIAHKLGLTVLDLLDSEHLNEAYFPRLRAIAIRPNIPHYLRRFLLGHSLGHHRLHRDLSLDYLRLHVLRGTANLGADQRKVTRLEAEADLFAAYLLVPGDRLRPVMMQDWFRRSRDPAVTLAIEFQVPIRAMRSRLVYEEVRLFKNQR